VSVITAPRRARVTIPPKFNTNFRLLMGGSFISMLGSRVSSIAYPLLVLALTGSPIDAGWASFAALAPSVLVYLPAGALVDRWNPRTAMLRSELSRSAAIMAIVALLAAHLIGVIGLVALVFGLIALAAIEQSLAVFSELAERRFASSLVEPCQVVPALARSEARTHMVILVGRPLGGLLFGLGRILPFLADVLTFAFAAGALTLIGRRQTGGSQERAASLRLGHEIAEGLRWLHRHRFAEIALLLTAGTTLISQALIMVFFAEAHAGHMSAIAIGVVLAASGAGGALGSAAASWLFRHFQNRYFENCLLQIQMWIWAAMFVMLFFLGGLSYLAMAVAMAIMGLTGALGNIEVDTFVVRHAETMLARVMSVDRLTSLCALALGPPLGAFLFARSGPQGAITALLAITMILLLVAAFPLRRVLRGNPRPESIGLTSGGSVEHDNGARADCDAVASLGGLPDPVGDARSRVSTLTIDATDGRVAGRMRSSGSHQDQEVVVEQEHAVSRAVRVIGPVQVQGESQGARVRLAGRRHLGAHRLNQRSSDASAPARKRRRRNGVCPAQDDNPLDESQQPGVGGGPFKPGSLIVLALRIVIPLLGPAISSLHKEQWDAKRQQ
jgi:MFS family permease